MQGENCRLAAITPAEWQDVASARMPAEQLETSATFRSGA